VLTKDISTPADIAPSALETIVFYCFMGYISALTYFLLLLLSGPDTLSTMPLRRHLSPLTEVHASPLNATWPDYY